MTKHACGVAIITLTCLTTLPAFSAEDPNQSEMRFRNLDQNMNDYISLYEARGAHRVFYYFQRADKNEDGHLDVIEFSAFEAEVPDFEVK